MHLEILPLKTHIVQSHLSVQKFIGITYNCVLI